jgi:hypothetical protein
MDLFFCFGRIEMSMDIDPLVYQDFLHVSAMCPPRGR